MSCHMEAALLTSFFSFPIQSQTCPSPCMLCPPRILAGKRHAEGRRGHRRPPPSWGAENKGERLFHVASVREINVSHRPRIGHQWGTTSPGSQILVLLQ